MNQKLEQYLQFFIDHRQIDWLEQLAIVEFVINNRIYGTTKISLFIANYNREIRMRADIKKKKKVEKVIEFIFIFKLRVKD